jgi:glycosyltransferase involved in cell wall biosynthesis
MSNHIDISVIIPSRADSSRATLIDRAIESVLGQNGVRITPIVVVNGHHYDLEVLHRLTQRTDIRCLRIDEGLPEARLAGRDATHTPFFAFLDDDDELLPNSIRTRLQPLLADDSIDVVVSNGFRVFADGATAITDPGIDRFQIDPLRGLAETNWLNENAGLFRARSIGREFFMNLPPVVEWTYLAFQLARSRNIRFLNTPTFLKHDTPASLSKSRQYLLEAPGVLLKISQLPMPQDIRQEVIRKYVSALHNVSVSHLQGRDFGAAWTFHLRSLLRWAGLQYLPYTRHIVRQQFAKRLPTKSEC